MNSIILAIICINRQTITSYQSMQIYDLLKSNRTFACPSMMAFTIKVLIGLLLITLVSPQVVSTVNFVSSSIIQTNSYMYGNSVGLSMRFDQLLNRFNDSLFQNYLSNSNVYGNWYGNFDQAIHMPVGYKYNCTTANQLTNTTNNCTLDLSTNSSQSLLTSIAQYLWNTTQGYAASLGWDMQAADFTNTNYMRNFANFVMGIYRQTGQPFNMQLVDKGDQFAALGLNPNYTASKMIEDCTAINTVFYGLLINGPGITDAADSSWYELIPDIKKYCGYFTARAVVFPNASALTISNLLSEKYTQQYLANRFTREGTKYFTAFAIGINDMRMVAADAGVDGLTNSFAAGIWAIEMAMEFAIIGGIRLDYFNPVANASFQSVTGQAPLFNPSSLYYALLFTIIANQNSPYIQLPVITANSSSSIKSYGLNQGISYGFILLNKDMNQSLNGQVQIAIAYPLGISCIYLRANYLNSTSEITLGGVRFAPNNSHYLGNYTEVNYYPADDGFYYVNISYAQAVYCYTIEEFTPVQFPTDSGNGALFTYASLILSLGAMLLLY